MWGMQFKNQNILLTVDGFVRELCSNTVKCTSIITTFKLGYFLLGVVQFY